MRFGGSRALCERGTLLHPDNLHARMLKPLMHKIGARKAAWHTLKHTYTSLQVAAGANIFQLSRAGARGHHSPAFTLSVVRHLLADEDLGAARPGGLSPAPTRKGLDGRYGTRGRALETTSARTWRALEVLLGDRINNSCLL